MSQPAPAPIPVDRLPDGPGVTRIDAADPAAPMYRLLERIRRPLTLRDTMILPVRTGYAGQTPPEGAAAVPRWDGMFPSVTVEEVYVPSAAGPVRCQVYRPRAEVSGLPLLLYVHGGGFMVGCSEDTDYMTRRLSAENELVAVSVNYRLAPEWPFPAGLDDCLAVYRWLRANGGLLGGDPTRIAVAGDSAGGNFAAALPLRARDLGQEMPQACVMFAPVVDLMFEQHESFNRLAPTGVVYDAAFAGFMRGAYCRYAEWAHPHVSPLHGNLTGFPPAIALVGTHDPIVDSCRAFVRRLHESGVAAAELFVAEGMPHGFYFWPGVFEAERPAYAAVAAFLRRHLHDRAAAAPPDA